MMFSETALMAIIGGLFALCMAALGYVFRRHVRDDDMRHEAHETTAQQILERVSAHDNYQRDFNLTLERRLTKMETTLELIAKTQINDRNDQNTGRRA